MERLSSRTVSLCYLLILSFSFVTLRLLLEKPLPAIVVIPLVVHLAAGAGFLVMIVKEAIEAPWKMRSIMGDMNDLSLGLVIMIRLEIMSAMLFIMMAAPYLFPAPGFVVPVILASIVWSAGIVSFARRGRGEKK